MPVSPDTLLRYLQRRGPFRGPAPRVLGVDDFAFLHGRRYGTVLVDLENNVPVDLLPDRSAETLAKWLREHPGAEIISRDRSSSYAEGIRQGAPEASEVADRWHLLRNLSEALGDVLAREHAALRQAAVEPRSDENDHDPSVPSPEQTDASAERWDRRSQRERERSAHSRERRLALYQQVIQLQEEGLTERQIAKRLGISRTTVRKYLSAGGFPERKERASPPGSVDRHADYLRRRWNEGCRNTKQLWRELREQGFEGKATAVWRYTWRWRPARNKSAAKAAGDESVPANPSPRTVVWWLLCPERRTEAQAAFVKRLEAHNSKIRLANELVTEFFGLVRERRPHDLEGWMKRAEASGLPDLVSFCNGVRRDWEAVRAGLTLEWSNGPVEGQVNRLKLIKRQMYGRASFRLLRARVLRPG
jgi:transposase